MWVGHLCDFWSLVTFCASSEGQSKSDHDCISIPELQDCSIPFSVNRLGQTISTSVCINLCSLSKFMPTSIFLGPTNISVLCVFGTVSGCGLAHAPCSTVVRSQLGVTLLSFGGPPLPWELLPSHGTAISFLPGTGKWLMFQSFSECSGNLSVQFSFPTSPAHSFWLLELSLSWVHWP